MKIAVSVSALLHALALGTVLARWDWVSGRDEVPAQIEMVFGNGAQATGEAATQPVSQSVHPAPPPDAGIAQAGAVSLPQTIAAPVRLGDGLAGFDLQHRDANIVEAQADPGNRPPPPPEAAFARGEHGSVVLRIHVRPDGTVGDIDTLASTGYADLDQDAIDAARHWRFLPQLRDGQAVASVREQQFDFVLR